jgi:hypothetical protein
MDGIGRNQPLTLLDAKEVASYFMFSYLYLILVYLHNGYIRSEASHSRSRPQATALGGEIVSPDNQLVCILAPS